MCAGRMKVGVCREDEGHVCREDEGRVCREDEGWCVLGR